MTFKIIEWYTRKNSLNNKKNDTWVTGSKIMRAFGDTHFTAANLELLHGYIKGFTSKILSYSMQLWDGNNSAATPSVTEHVFICMIIIVDGCITFSFNCLETSKEDKLQPLRNE